MSTTDTDTTTTTAPASPGRLGPAELRQQLSGDDAPRVLDVRTPAEFESMHIPGSYNVPLDTLREHRDELRRHLDEEVVLVCRSGVRAEQALVTAGMPNVHVLDGGITSWERHGGALNRGRQRWDIERQVRLVAGLLVAAGGVGSLIVPGLVWLAIAVGTGLATAALTNTCAMGMALARLPFNQGASCDIETVVRELSVGTSSEG